MDTKRSAAGLLFGVLLASYSSAPIPATAAHPASSARSSAAVATRGATVAPSTTIVAAIPTPTPAPPAAATPTPVGTPTPAAALGDPVVGRMAAVITDTRLVVRSAPGTGQASKTLAWYLYPQQLAEVLAGPVLANGYPWYRVRVNKDTGWVAGRSLSGEPWLAEAAFRALAVGDSHTCAVTSAGGVKCWGDNRYGQLGDGTTSATASPVDVVGLPNGAIAIAAGGGMHTCALTGVGGIVCWGANPYGELGDGTTTDRHAPVAVVGLSGPVTALAAGIGRTCALTSGGGVMCWGFLEWLGNGAMARSSSPVEVTGLSSGVTALAAGSGHACAITSGGGVKCWGDNRYGQLGDGTQANSSSPVDVVGLGNPATAIAAGGLHTCAVTGGGAVKCWGYNRYGQLGTGAGLVTGVTAISAGQFHTCALAAGGVVTCWGANSSGQLGDGTTTARSVPARPIGLASGATSVSAGDARACALTAAGGVKCWGSGSSGQFVGGPKPDNTVPSDVDFSTHQTIVLQRPTFGARVLRGTKVTFTATVGPPAPADARATVRFTFRRVVDGHLVVVAQRDVRVTANGQAILVWSSWDTGAWNVRAWALPNARQPASRWSAGFSFSVRAVL